MRTRLAEVVAVLGVLAAGCASIPGSGPVRVEQRVPVLDVANEPDIRVLPPVPQPGETPVQIVAGFLQAEANDSDHYAIARLYLTPQAALQWSDTASVVVYDNSALTLAQTGPTSVTAAAREVGELDGHGDYTPLDAPLHDTYRLVKVEGQWRLSVVPPGVRLNVRDLQRTYRAEQLYYLTPDLRLLVPETVYLPASRSALPTELMRALLSGPDAWLAPGVRTALPPGAALPGTATLVGGVVQVDIGVPPGQVSAAALPGLLAQVTATLLQLPGVSGVRITGDGQPLQLSGAGGEALGPSVGNAFEPDALPVGPARTTGLPGASGFAVSADGSRTAVLVGPPGAVRVLVTTGGGPARTVAGPGPYAGVSFAPDGTLYVAGADGVLVVPPSGAPAPLAGAGPAAAFVVARDGVRVAVLTPGGTAELGVLAPGRRLAAVRPLAPSVARVSTVVWASQDSLDLLAAGPAGGSLLWQVSADGSAVTSIPVQPPLPGPPSWLAAAPGRPLLLEVSGQVWQQTGPGFTRSGSGSLPTYPG
ncbi:MAG: LpqB family beta-propeller domain-containing protein [Mycobacteriales bacterium]